MSDRFAANRGADIVRWYKMAAMVDEKQAAIRILTDVAAWAAENGVQLAAPEPSNSHQIAVKQGERQPVESGHVHQWQPALGLGQNVEICACGWTQWK